MKDKGSKNLRSLTSMGFDLDEDKALSLLIDYYNLRLVIEETNSKLTISDEEFEKITTFFEKYSDYTDSQPDTKKTRSPINLWC